MELKDKLTMLISSCDAFSGLWDLHMEFLGKNWPDPEMRKILVTDRPTERQYAQAEIISVGAEKEWAERLEYAVSQIKTEYVFVTLDDYFLTTPVDLGKIKGIIRMMEEDSLDYVRLSGFVKHPKKMAVDGRKKTYRQDTSKCYSVNLTAGIWRRTFLEQTFREPKTAWQYEVSLARIARECGAKCVLCKDHDFRVLDVVRKGKLLNKASRYFKKHDLYHGGREVISIWYEVKIFLRTWANRLLPQSVTDKLRSVMIRRGHQFFSQEA